MPTWTVASPEKSLPGASLSSPFRSQLDPCCTPSRVHPTYRPSWRLVRVRPTLKSRSSARSYTTGGMASVTRNKRSVRASMGGPRVCGDVATVHLRPMQCLQPHSALASGQLPPGRGIVGCAKLDVAEMARDVRRDAMRARVPSVETRVRAPLAWKRRRTVCEAHAGHRIDD